MKHFRKSGIVVLGIVFLIVVVLVGGCRKAGIWLVKEDPVDKADAMVMLMGSIPDRVLQVADLYEEKVAGQIVMVEEAMGSYQKLEARGVRVIKNSIRAQNALVELGIPGDNIVVVPGDAVSTQMEAIIIRDYLATKPEIKSVLLVSSASHMRRASMIFSTAFKELDHPVDVLCSPSSYTSFHAKRWWRKREDIQHVVMEYMKMGSFFLFDRRKLRN